MSSAIVPVSTDLALIADAARGFAAASQAENTTRSGKACWKDFELWCEEHHLEALPAKPATVVLYITDLASRLKVGTMAVRLWAIGARHESAHLESPVKDFGVQKTWAGIRRTLGTSQRRVAPVVTADLRRIIQAIPETVSGLRDRALLLIGFAAALRRSELVALEVADVTYVAEGVRLTIRSSKTDQEKEGTVLGIPYGAHADTCPVRALRAYLEAAWVVSGPLFRSIDKAGHCGDSLSADSVADIVKRTAAAAGMDPSTVSGHSLRAGFCTSAATADVPEWRIARQSRHKSIPTLRRYVREASIFRGNAAGDVGL
jgi:integrase